MKREDIVAKLTPFITKGLADIAAEAIGHAGLTIIEKVPSEAEIERIYDALKRRGKDPDSGDARAAAAAVRDGDERK